MLSGSLSEGISWAILAFFVGCVKAGGSGACCAARGAGCAAGRSSAGGLQRRVFPSRYIARGGGCAAGRGFTCERPRKQLPSRRAAQGGGCAAGRGFACERPRKPFLSRCAAWGGWRLRGGAKFRWRLAAEGVFSALRRAGGCVGAGPAGRCGRFSCFAHAPLIKKSGQKRNQGLL